MFHFIEKTITDFSSVSPMLAYLLLFAIIFAETGLMIGFFLPGDSLLFAVGFLSSKIPQLNIFILLPILFTAAVIGDSVGYAFGHKVGRRLFKKEKSFLFDKENLIRAEKFYESHGGKTIILARFIPAIRTFAPIIAGIGNMKYSSFLLYNVVGGFLWAVGLTLVGYFFGSLIPKEKIDIYLLPIIFLIILGSIAPALLHMIKTKEQRARVYRHTKNFFKKK